MTAITGCVSSGVTAAEPQEIEPIDPDEAPGPFVPAGAPVLIQLDQSLGTGTSVPGARFTAKVVNPLRSRDGRVIVPDGARVWGQVVKVDTGTSPRLVLDFSTVETASGVATLEARIRKAQKTTYPGAPEAYTYDPLWGPTEPLYYDPLIGGGYAYDADIYPELGIYEPVNAREILLPAGSRISLTLTRPILMLGGAQQGGAQQGGTQQGGTQQGGTQQGAPQQGGGTQK